MDGMGGINRRFVCFHREVVDSSTGIQSPVSPRRRALIHVTLVAERTLQVAFGLVKTKAGMVHVLAGGWQT